MVQRNQAGFVKGRSLQENVLLASELVINFHKNSPAKRGVLKIDLAKAYDNVHWNFIFNILLSLDVPQKFVNWIQQCISTPTYSVNLNGELVGFFPGAKGLRQGDPLSSSLFILVMDVLARSLDKAVCDDRIRLHPTHLNPMISHLSFADDLLVFFDGSSSSLQGILQVLEEFRASSGLHINCNKTVLFLDGNNPDSLEQLATQAGVSKGTLPVKYLGLPLTPHKLKNSDWMILVERIQNRLDTWMVRHLSFAGRLQLIKSVLNSIINYWLSVFILPRTCIKQLEQICKAFLWKGNSESAKGAKISWNVVCSPKQNGGLGLRRLMEWNRVFGLKLIWRFTTATDSLWAEWALNHLIGKKGFWTANLCIKGNWGWRRIMKLRDTAKEFLSCKVISGKQVSFWLEKWLPQGILIELIGSMGPAITGIPIHTKVEQVINHGEWTISRSRNPTISQLCRLLPPTPPCLNSDSQDQYCWKSTSTTSLPKFHSRNTWLLTQPTLTLVTWAKAIWFKECTPKQAFTAWIIAWGRLPTRDRMRSWGLTVPQECIFIKFIYI